MRENHRVWGGGTEDEPVGHVLISSFTWAMSLVILLISHKGIPEFLQGKMPQAALFLYPLDERFPWKKRNRFFYTLSSCQIHRVVFFLFHYPLGSINCFVIHLEHVFLFPSTAHSAHFLFTLNYIF